MAQHTNKPKKHNIVRVVLLTAVALILGLSLYSWNAESLTGNKMPMPLGFGASVVLSGSMESALSVDDLVIIRKTQAIDINDIVVYQDGNSLVIHRVIEIDGDKITTKGDANNTADAPIDRSLVKGVLVCAVPYVGAIVGFLRQPAVVIILLAGAVFLTERSYRKKKSRDADELDKLKEEIEKLMNDMKD